MLINHLSQLGMSIGSQVVLLLELKIKDHADHAGHLLLLELLKDGGNLLEEVSHLSLNNNLLIAQQAMELKLAMVDYLMMPSNIQEITDLLLKLPIHTRLLNKLAKPTLEHTRTPNTLMFLDAPTLLTPSPEDQSQSLSMPATGHHTKAEFSTTARPH
jgi:hypothetical protein